MNQAVTLPAALLMRQAETILTGWGMPEDIAVQTAELMVETDLFGVDSHGISMLPHYDKLLQAGLWNPAGRANIIRETPATAVIDGCHSLGHATALLAIQTAVAKSELSGMGSVVVRHSNHFGAAGLYARYAAARGKIALITSTTRSRMLVPSRAQVPVLGTNPLAFAAPAERNADFVLDMATTTVAANKVKVYDFTGEALPPGWVSDEHGEAVTDSALGMEYVFQRPPGGLTPLGGLEETGGHKGYGLAMLAQILAGPLAGASFAATRPAGGMPDIGHFFLVIDPAAFGDPSDFRQGLDHIIDTLHDTPPADASKPVLVAGDIENQTHKQRSLSGIPLPAALIAQLQALCQRSGFTDFLAAHLPPSSS